MRTMGIMGMMRKIIVTIVAIVGIVPLRAQVALSADTIVLGDTTVLTVDAADDLAVDGDLIEVLGEESGNGVRRFFLTSYDPGIHYIKWGEEDSLALVVLGVDVDPRSDEPKELADSTAIEDIVDIEPAAQPLAPKKSFPWLLIAVGVVVAALLIWWLLRRRKKNGEESPRITDTRTPEERALDRLEELRQGQLWQSGRVKEYYTELTDTLRVFIEEATGLRATEMTSEECVNALMCKCMSADTTTLLREVFTTADLVKFAKSEPLTHVHQRTYDDAVEFVKGLWACVNVTTGNDENNGNDVDNA